MTATLAGIDALVTQIKARPRSSDDAVDLLANKGVSTGPDPKLEIKKVYYGSDEGGTQSAQV